MTVNKVYIPLTLFSFALEYHFFGHNPFIYHFTNLLLHMIVTGLIFLFSLRIGANLRAAFLGALLFGLHPMHVESVAWISERKDVLYAFFYMLALCNYWSYLESKQKTPYFLTVLFGLLSILTKPMALSLPLAFFVCDWFYGRKLNAKVFADKIPHFLYIIPIAWKTYSLFSRVPFKHIENAILIWVWTFIFYIRKFVFPVNLLPHYELPHPILLFHPSYITSLWLFCLLLYLIYHFRNNRWLIFACLFYFVSIFFLLRYADVRMFGNLSVVADRFMYLPSMGFCIFFGVLMDEIFEADVTKGKVFQKVGYFCAVILFMGLSFSTYNQTKIWRNEIRLWTYVIQKSPQDALAYVNRAIEYKKRRQYDLAIADCTRAIDINPQFYISAYTSKNNKYSINNNRFIEIDQTNTALTNNPYLVVAYRERGFIYKMTKQYPLAIADFNKVISINPQDAEVYFNRSRVFYALGEQKKANENASKAKLLGYAVDDSYTNGL